MKPSQADAYWSGYRAASAGRKRSAPSTLDFEMVHWWLGGYSDWEIENLVDINQPSA